MCARILVLLDPLVGHACMHVSLEAMGGQLTRLALSPDVCVLRDWQMKKLPLTVDTGKGLRRSQAKLSAPGVSPCPVHRVSTMVT